MKQFLKWSPLQRNTLWRLLTRIAERTLGLGVTSARSSLGRRIQQVLRGERGRSLSNVWRLAIAGGLALAALAVAVTLFFPPPVPGFSWAKAQGWNMQPVRVVSLQPAWLGRLEGVPPGMSPRDLAIARACQSVGWPYITAKSIACRHRYEQLVAQYPHAFYPEYCLAEWYQVNKQAVPYQYWEQRALHDAPRVLAGRITDADGKPLASATFWLELSTLDLRSPTLSQAITYQNQVTTDQGGCYYMPVFNDVYVMAWTIGFHGSGSQGPLQNAEKQGLNFDVTGGLPDDSTKKISWQQPLFGLTAPAHVGILPQITARPPIRLISNAGRALGSEQHPVLIYGNSFNLSWPPEKGAVRYTVQINSISQTEGESMPLLFNSPLFRGGSAQTHLHIPLSANDAPQSNYTMARYQTYYLTVIGYRSSATTLDSIINMSQQLFFIPVNAVTSEPLTRSNFLRALGPNSTISSFTPWGNYVIISGFVPVGVLNSVRISDKFDPLFGHNNHNGQASDFLLGSEDNQGRQSFTVTMLRKQPGAVKQPLR